MWGSVGDGSVVYVCGMVCVCGIACMWYGLCGMLCYVVLCMWYGVYVVWCVYVV